MKIILSGNPLFKKLIINMKNFILILLTSLFCFIATMAVAQEEEKNNDPTGWKKADKQYQQKGYMASASNYQMKHDKGEMTPEVMSRVANSYRLNGESELAEYWFAQCINNTTVVEDKLHYAQVLQSNGKCEDAVRWFKEYKRAAKGVKNRDFVTDCSEMETFVKNKNIEVQNVAALNTKHLDYSAVVTEDGVMFTSTRGKSGASRTTDNWTKDNFSDIFFATTDEEGNLNTPRRLGSEINKRYHDGATSVSEEGTIMYFSRNNSKGKAKGKIIDLKIYSATRTNKVWKNVTELPINGDDFATCHPSISKDGKTLYFSSDRPGGFGGMDIYVSKNENGIWQQPVNLGPTVNTSGNEIFPFASPAGNLFFASNGHKGLGGLDVFKVEKTDKNDESTWSVRTNIGKPYNTKKDDFGFTGNMDMTKGFLTSNRPGGKGGDDIYEWTTTDEKGIEVEEESKINVMVVDYATGDAIRNAMVTVKDANGTIVKNNATTNKKGLFVHNVEKGKNYTVIVEKDGYTIAEKMMSAKELLENESVRLDLEKAKCVALSGTVLNDKYKKGIPSANITVINKCTGEKSVVTSNADGTFDFCLERECDFEIIANKNAFEETQVKVSTIKMGVGENTKKLKMELLSVVKPVVTAPTRTTTPTKVTPTNNTPTKVITTPVVTTPTRTTTTGTTTSTTPTPSTAPTTTTNSTVITTTTSVGSIMTLNNIYYDYDKWNIRTDAITELDQIVNMMKNSPNMEIMLSSHTDARGDNTYNQILSTKRAESARKYLISKGIQAHRVKSKGFGETQLINHCRDNVKCTNDEHQVNRRTEVQITKQN